MIAMPLPGSVPAGDPNLTPDPRDVVDLSFHPAAPEVGGGAAPARPERTGGNAQTGAGGGFLRLWFSCAGAYGRAYRNREGTKYIGRCPKCGQCAQFGIGQGGTSRRQFEVSCGR